MLLVSGIRKVDSFDARGIFKQYGSEEWEQYLIPKAYLSQIFSFDTDMDTIIVVLQFKC